MLCVLRRRVTSERCIPDAYGQKKTNQAVYQVYQFIQSKVYPEYQSIKSIYQTQKSNTILAVYGKTIQCPTTLKRIDVKINHLEYFIKLFKSNFFISQSAQVNCTAKES